MAVQRIVPLKNCHLENWTAEELPQVFADYFRRSHRWV